MEKACKRCGDIKPLTEFHKDRQKTDGLSTWCKPCNRSTKKEYDKRPPKRQCAPGMHYCTDCKTEKPMEDFHNNSASYTGKADVCKPCVKVRTANRKPTEKTRARSAEVSREWRARNPELAKDVKRRIIYGVPIGWYAEQLERQGGKCAICDSPEPKGHGDFHIDHCHDTNQVRGLLCQPCNLGIGQLSHSVEILQSAINYLSEGPGEG